MNNNLKFHYICQNYIKMKSFKKVLSLFFISLTIVSYSQEKKEYHTKNVFIIVMDGPRYSETWGDSTHQYIPRMSKEMSKEGVVSTNFRNNGPTYTNSGHTALTTGIYQQLNNTGKQLPKKPSIFQYWRKAYDTPDSSTYIIASKDKLEVLANCKDSKWANMYQPLTDCGVSGNGSSYRADITTYNNTLSILKKTKPNLVLINFKEPDASGHGNLWERYLKEITVVDEYIYQIWKFLKNDSFYGGTTTVFVTNDHGRHLDGKKDGFISHGCNCEGCRKINFFAYGPDFKSDVIFDNERHLIDIPATIAELLHFDMPTGKGEVMTELFK